MNLPPVNRALRALTLALAAALALAAPGAPAVAAAKDGLTLLMLDERGCVWCARWEAEVGAVYARTAEGRDAPLVRQSIRAALPEGVALDRAARFTPTFVLIRDGAEVGRIEGYPGEDFFYGLLQALIERADAPGGEDP